MSYLTIENGESGISVRNKINQIISDLNDDKILQGQNYVYLISKGTPLENGLRLFNLYNALKTSTPNGESLSNDNRITLALAPGVYNMDTERLILDNQFIDLISMNSLSNVYIDTNFYDEDLLVESFSIVLNVSGIRLQGILPYPPHSIDYGYNNLNNSLETTSLFISGSNQDENSSNPIEGSLSFNNGSVLYDGDIKNYKFSSYWRKSNEINNKIKVGSNIKRGSSLKLKDGKYYKILIKATGNFTLQNNISFEAEYDLRYSFGDNQFLISENYFYKKDDVDYNVSLSIEDSEVYLNLDLDLIDLHINYDVSELYTEGEDVGYYGSLSY